MAYISKCSCGFVSPAQQWDFEAANLYRQHEQGHEPGQREGRIEQVDALPAAAQEVVEPSAEGARAHETKTKTKPSRARRDPFISGEEK